MSKIIYLGFYDTQENTRNVSMAAANKMDYICEALNKSGLDTEIVSCSMNGSVKYPAHSETANGYMVHFFKTKPLSGNKLFRGTDRIRRAATLFGYLIKNISKDDTLIVYHSLALMNCISLAKKLIGFRIILEVEEIYNDVIKKSDNARKREIAFTQIADGYIFPTELLNKLINKSDKPYIIIHGTYKVEKDRCIGFDDNKIHVVYAGTFDPRKGGVDAAAAAEHLPDNYHMHILGFGSDDDIAKIKEAIEAVKQKSEAELTYHGLLTGEKYIEFLQKCHIGLSTQNPDADFNATSFPSKILSYMANGLRVVTIRIPAIEGSDIGGAVNYYEVQKPDEIAKAIMRIDINDGYDSRGGISELDKKFREDIREMLG